MSEVREKDEVGFQPLRIALRVLILLAVLSALWWAYSPAISCDGTVVRGLVRMVCVEATTT